jgi:hypothetical protein
VQLTHQGEKRGALRDRHEVRRIRTVEHGQHLDVLLSPRLELALGLLAQPVGQEAVFLLQDSPRTAGLVNQRQVVDRAPSPGLDQGNKGCLFG